MRTRILLVAMMAAMVTLFMVGQAWARCSTPCLPKMNCIQVCGPELW